MAQGTKKEVVNGNIPEIKKNAPQRRKTTKPDTLKKVTEQQRTISAKNAMVDAMTQALGIVTTASKIAGVSRSQHYEWINSDPEYVKKIDEVTQMAHDFVESQLYAQIKDGSTTATIFYMKCKMRERGYIEKVDVDMSVNRPDLSDMTTEEIRRYMIQQKNG
jgi:hypothetical protein